MELRLEWTKDMKIFDKYRKNLILVLVVLMIVFSAQAIYASSLTEVNEVAREFICNCGCNKLLPNCDMQCGKDLRAAIGKKLDSGMNKEQIVNYMLKNYNKQILSAPPMKGFDLSAWITPYIIIAIGGGLIMAVIVAWTRASSQTPEPGPQTSEEKLKEEPKIDDKYKDKLDQELKDFDW